jgi:hypothetical protein
MTKIIGYTEQTLSFSENKKLRVSQRFLSKISSCKYLMICFRVITGFDYYNYQSNKKV